MLSVGAIQHWPKQTLVRKGLISLNTSQSIIDEIQNRKSRQDLKQKLRRKLLTGSLPLACSATFPKHLPSSGTAHSGLDSSCTDLHIGQSAGAILQLTFPLARCFKWSTKGSHHIHQMQNNKKLKITSNEKKREKEIGREGDRERGREKLI